MDPSEKSESRRRGVQCALLLAVCALVASLAALGTVLAIRAPSPTGAPPSPTTPGASQSPTTRGTPHSPTPPPPGFGENYTHLIFNINRTTSHIEDKTLDWWNHKFDRTMFSRIFEYRPKRLVIKYDGLYNIYAQMNISHQLPRRTEEVNISLIINGHRDGSSFRILTLPLSYPPIEHTKDTAVTVFMEVSSYQLKKNDQLSVELMAGKLYEHWIFGTKGNFFGVHQIPEELDVTGNKCLH